MTSHIYRLIHLYFYFERKVLICSKAGLLEIDKDLSLFPFQSPMKSTGGGPIFEGMLCRKNVKALKTPFSAHSSPKKPLKFCSVTQRPMFFFLFCFVFLIKNNKFVT